MRISKQKRDRIIEQILTYLYQIFPKYPFTAEIAQEIARDEEFIKKILLDLKEKNIVIVIKKDSEGNPFSRRMRWKLSNKVYDVFHRQNLKSIN